MFMKTNLFIFPETEISIRRTTLRRFRQGHRIIFPYKDYASPQVKKQKIVESDNDQTCENFQTTRQTEYLLWVKGFHEKVKWVHFMFELHVITAFISEML